MCISKIVLDLRAEKAYSKRDLDCRMMSYVNGVAT